MDGALVAPAIANLRATADLEIHYGTDRPVVLDLWATPDRVREETAEAREVRVPPPEAEPWLSRCQSIVGIELGFSMLEDMGIVLAYEAARFLAQKYDGVIVDDDDTWQAVEDGQFVPVGGVS